MDQGSIEWIEARLGKVTASRLDDLMAATKSGPAASRRNYMAELLTERLTGQAYPQFISADMLRGIELEPAAREAYEIETGETVSRMGFVPHACIEMTGASPDGAVGDEGLVEIKCPKTATHLSYLLAGVPPADYVPQMTWQVACTGREWCDFVSYDPRLPENLQLFIVRFVPTEVQLNAAERAVEEFLKELDDLEKRVRALRR